MKKQNINYYKFVDHKNNNIGISDSQNPELLMRELIADGVEIGGFSLMNTNDAICELSKRKNNPLPMDYCNLYNQGIDCNYTEPYAILEN